VGVHRDITETKNMRDKLIRSERLAAVGELASGVGHELRNPLNVIRNCVYLLNMTLGDQADNDTLSTLKMLDQQVDISNKIVTDLLNFTRIRPPCLERTDLNGLVRESLTWVAKPEDVLVVTTFGEDSPKIRVDAEQVGRAFANIIANAVQSMNGTGEFRVATGAENGHAWARFEDTGCGIPKENLDKIFQPLFTTKPRGIGLGLAITKGLVEQNGGAIEVSSQIEQGTTFTIRLPVCKEGD
jgi:signal transduction histidine kinase